MEKEHKLEQILENLWQGEIDISKAHQKILALFDVIKSVSDNDTPKCEHLYDNRKCIKCGKPRY